MARGGGITVSADLAPTQQLATVKGLILGDVRRALRQGQQAGFPTDPDDYELIVKQGGRSRIVNQPASLTPKSFKIGTRTRPTEFEFVTEGDTTDMIEAASDAVTMLRRRSPVRSGQYLSSMQTVFNGRAVSLAGLQTLDLGADPRIRITNFAPYATTIEAGFYNGYYETQQLRGGIFYFVAKSIASKFGNRISIRFLYRKVGRSGTLPVIEIGPSGAFAQSFTVPGRAQRRARRRRNS